MDLEAGSIRPRSDGEGGGPAAGRETDVSVPVGKTPTLFSFMCSNVLLSSS